MKKTLLLTMRFRARQIQKARCAVGGFEFDRKSTAGFTINCLAAISFRRSKHLLKFYVYQKVGRNCVFLSEIFGAYARLSDFAISCRAVFP